MNKPLLRQIEVVPSDINNVLRVFLFSNLSEIITPDDVVEITPPVQASLVIGLNNIQTRNTANLENDLNDILGTFIIANASQIITSTAVVVNSSDLSLTSSMMVSQLQ